MKNIRIVPSVLTDGSKTYAVKFEATHGDLTDMTVSIECTDEKAAGRVIDALNSTDVCEAVTNAAE